MSRPTEGETGATPSIEAVRPGVWALAVPMPGPLGCVYVYVLETPNGVLLIDAGPPGPIALSTVMDGLRAVGASPSDVDGVLFTHTHFDHFGLGATLQEATGAWLAAHPAETERLARFAAYDIGDLERVLRAFGVQGDELNSMLTSSRAEIQPMPDLAPPDRAVADGDSFPLNDGSLVAMHTPGHAEGHLCYVYAEAELVFSGDHVLSYTTPNVGLSPGDAGSPLADYLRALENVQSLGEMLSLPGHERRIPVAPRARALVEHHEARLLEAADAVQAGHSTVRAVAERMTWSMPWDTYGSLDRMMAMREAHAHLVVLEERGILTRDSDAPLRFA